MRGTGYDAIKHGAGAFEGKQTCCILNPFFSQFLPTDFYCSYFHEGRSHDAVGYKAPVSLTLLSSLNIFTNQFLANLLSEHFLLTIHF